MKFLCLAYGDEEGWNTLTAQQKEEVLAEDAVIAGRGNLMGPVRPEVTTVTNWDMNLEVVAAPYATADKLPLAGFSIIEAQCIEEVIDMVANTPCARARGYIEVRPFWDTSEDA
jgi:hypothetical protein